MNSHLHTIAPHKLIENNLKEEGRGCFKHENLYTFQQSFIALCGSQKLWQVIILFLFLNGFANIIILYSHVSFFFSTWCIGYDFVLDITLVHLPQFKCLIYWSHRTTTQERFLSKDYTKYAAGDLTFIWGSEFGYLRISVNFCVFQSHFENTFSCFWLKCTLHIVYFMHSFQVSNIILSLPSQPFYPCWSSQWDISWNEMYILQKKVE